MLVVSFLAAVSAAPSRELQTAPSWCNAYTCSLAACAGFSGCPVGTTCEWWCNSFTSSLAHCGACTATGPAEAMSYSYTTDVMYTPGTGVQPYTKIQSASCGYADLMGAVFNDPTIFTEVPVFYGFYSDTTPDPLTGNLGYETDTAMTSPDACNAWCAGNFACAMWYYQYEYTATSRMAAAGAEGRWMHKCQLLKPFDATDCGSPFAGDTNDWDEYAGRASAAGAK